MTKLTFLFVSLATLITCSPLSTAQNVYFGTNNSAAGQASTTSVVSPQDYKQNVAATYQKKQQEREQKFDAELTKKLGNSQKMPGTGTAPVKAPAQAPSYSSFSNPTTGTQPATSAGSSEGNYYSGFQNNPSGGAVGNNTNNPSPPASGGGWNVKY